MKIWFDMMATSTPMDMMDEMIDISNGCQSY